MKALLARWATYPAMRKYESLCLRPEEAQEAMWKSIRQRISRGTHWGASIKSSTLSSFEVTTYEEYRTVFENAFAEGTPSPLDGDEVLFWAETSGTTGKRKLFPYTRFFTKMQGVWGGAWFHSILRAEPPRGLFDGPGLTVAPLASTEASPKGVGVGLSGYWLHSQSKMKNAIPLEIFRDQETFEEFAPLWALAGDLGSMGANTPGRILQFFKHVVGQRERVLRQLRDGVPARAGVPVPKVGKERMAQLMAAFACDMPTMKDLWPKLSLLSVWQSGVCALQADALRPLVGDGVLWRDLPTISTEGVLNVPLGNGFGGPPALECSVVEFADPGLSELRKDQLIGARDLKVGEAYQVILTNTMGLVRYQTGDVVRCNGKFLGVPSFEFVSKIGTSLSLGGLRLSEADVAYALAFAELSLRGRFMFAPGTTGDRVILWSEADALTPDQVAKLDLGLRKSNKYYDSQRKQGRVQHLSAGRVDASFFPQLPTHGQSKPRVLWSVPLSHAATGETTVGEQHSVS